MPSPRDTLKRTEEILEEVLRIATHDQESLHSVLSETDRSEVEEEVQRYG